MSKSAKSPASFIQELARQTQLLACLNWLSDFQLLACIPVGDKVTFTNAANIASVSPTELCRVVRMTATAGILCEPEPGFVAHSPLSAHFVTKPSLLDAAAFLAETAAPAAFHMADATRLRQKYPEQQAHSLTAYAIASSSPSNHPSTMTSFAARCEQEPKLRRRLAAFQRLEASLVDEGVVSVISSLDWRSLGPAKVVEVGAQSTAVAIALRDREPDLHLVVQLRDDCLFRDHHHPLPSFPASGNGASKSAETSPNLTSRITLQHRTLGAPQPVDDAAVYILHLPDPFLSPPSSTTVSAQITAELRAHCSVLRPNSAAALVLVARLVPDAPGTMDADVESLARMHDLCLLQMTNGRALETAQLLELVDSVRDGAGRGLVVVNRLASRRHYIVALEVQMRPLPSSQQYGRG
ncbi:hypothetical protein BDR22DRAFT_895535 [Usnea florida]